MTKRWPRLLHFCAFLHKILVILQTHSLLHRFWSGRRLFLQLQNRREKEVQLSINTNHDITHYYGLHTFTADKNCSVKRFDTSGQQHLCRREQMGFNRCTHFFQITQKLHPCELTYLCPASPPLTLNAAVPLTQF